MFIVDIILVDTIEILTAISQPSMWTKEGEREAWYTKSSAYRIIIYYC